MCGPVCTASSSTNLVLRGNWTGLGSPLTPSVSAPSKGAVDRTESDRPRQDGIENPPRRRPCWPARLRRHLGRQHSRQPGLAAAGHGDSAGSPPPRTAASTAGRAPRRQKLRLSLPAAMASRARHHTSHRPPRHRYFTATWPTPLGGRTDHVLARSTQHTGGRRGPVGSYPAMLGVPHDLVEHVAWLLHEHRLARNTRWLERIGCPASRDDSAADWDVHCGSS